MRPEERGPGRGLSPDDEADVVDVPVGVGVDVQSRGHFGADGIDRVSKQRMFPRRPFGLPVVARGIRRGIIGHVVGAGIGILVGEDPGRRPGIAGRTDGQLIVGDLGEIVPERAHSGGRGIQRRLSVIDEGLGELRLVRESDIDDQVVDRPGLREVDDRLIRGRGDPHLPHLRVVEELGLDAGLLESADVGAPGDESSRHELPVDLVGVNKEACGRIPQDRETVLVVKPVVVLVAAGQTAQDGAVRLLDMDRDVPEIGRLEKDPDGKDKGQAKTEPF